jgi:hypothetical protein
MGSFVQANYQDVHVYANFGYFSGYKYLQLNNLRCDLEELYMSQ